MELPISVVMPVYNRANIVRDAIESIFMQSAKPYEIIIIDDASTDNLSTVLAPYFSRIIYRKLDANHGVSFARNFGITLASAQYVALLDSDDIFLTDKLKLQYEFMLTHGYAISHSDELWLRGEKWINKGSNNARCGDDIFEKVLDKCRVSPSTLIINKKVFEDIGMFDITLRTCEDYEFILRAARKYMIGYLEKSLVIKRAVSDDQLSKSIKHIESIRLNILQKFKVSYEHELETVQLESVNKEIIRKQSIVKVV